jgi:uncharacterized protein (UPF0333 family)
MRGQTAIEYLVVFSAVLMIFASVTIVQMINPSKEAARDTLYLSQARSAADAIAGAIDTVYANGRGAVKSVSVCMDGGWSLQLDNVGNKLRIIVGTSEGNENIEDNLRYEIDNYHSLSGIPSGIYTVIVEWSENKQKLENIDGRAIVSGKIYIYIRLRGT